ncbi:MAG: ABC transporter substrate-binding protein [Desulfobacterales bacterium]|nr:MAG: ABC transporter substrate-binding protein [Desulfobacterales bacterium]
MSRYHLGSLLQRFFVLGSVFVFILLSSLFLISLNGFCQESFTIIDTAGRKVELPVNLQRIVTGPVVMPNLIFAVDGSGDKLVGMHPMSKSAWKNSVLKIMAPGMAKASTDFIQGGFKMNVEEVLKLKPDVVFQVSFEKGNIAQFEKLGIPVIVTHEGLRNLDQYLEKHISLVGKVLRKEERADELIADFKAADQMIARRLTDIPKEKWPRGLILFNVEKRMVTGTGSFANYWLNHTGAENVAQAIKTSPRGATVNMEQILAWNPEIIYITNFCPTRPEDLYNNAIPGQDWREISAVKNRRVYKIPLGEYRWYPPSGDSSLMLKWMAQKNHPERFGDYDIREEIRSHFTRIYNFTLSEKQIDRILNPASTGSWREK